jgi:hypothetical protein
VINGKPINAVKYADVVVFRFLSRPPISSGPKNGGQPMVAAYFPLPYWFPAGVFALALLACMGGRYREYQTFTSTMPGRKVRLTRMRIGFRISLEHNFTRIGAVTWARPL